MYKFACAGVEILEYTPLELKSAICGNGKADKLQLQKSIKIFFELDEIPKPDIVIDIQKSEDELTRFVTLTTPSEFLAQTLQEQLHGA